MTAFLFGKELQSYPFCNIESITVGTPISSRKLLSWSKSLLLDVNTLEFLRVTQLLWQSQFTLRHLNLAMTWTDYHAGAFSQLK